VPAAYNRDIRRNILILALAASPAWCQPGKLDCRSPDPTTANFAFPLNPLPDACFLATGGFSQDAGSFASLAAFGGNYLHLGETLNFGAQYGVRARSLQLGMVRPLTPDNRIQAGFALFAQRFRYDQSQDASLLSFSRTVTETQDLDPADQLKYVSHRYGVESFVQMALHDGFSSFKLSYSFEVTGVRPLSASTSDYFNDVHFLSGTGVNKLTGIKTSRVSASYLRSTIDHPLRPTRGAMISASFGLAGLGGDVNLLEPAIEAKWFHRGLFPRHVIATHFRGSILSGFAGKAPPPFDRDYLGGEQEIRGFSSWAISPIAFVPGVATLPVLNSNGTPRTQMVGSTVLPVTIPVPVDRPIVVGGDTKLVGNVEYRIPLFGPFTLALFVDAGMDRATFAGGLNLNSGVTENLNSEFYLLLTNRPLFQPGWRQVQMSTGAELQVLLPKVQLPLRLYWAYNPLACTAPPVYLTASPPCGVLAAPILASNLFPNSATYDSFLRTFGASQLFQEPRSMLRIAIGFAF
jgi:outer membrane protein insertion porin family